MVYQNGNGRGRLTDTLASPEFKSAVLLYKYQGPDLSLLERLFLEDWWDYLAQHVYPAWLAPNLITLMGGACVIASLALCFTFSPGLAGESPGWVYVLCAALLFSYQSLDGSDGKQARKTKSGSALGELMDHGLDAFVVAPICVFTIDAVGFGWSSGWFWTITCGGQWAFALSNMTLLMCGKMSVNLFDVMELQTAMMVILCVNATWGTQVFATPVTVYGSVYELRDLMAMVSVGGLAISLGRNLHQILGKTSTEVPDPQLPQIFAGLLSFNLIGYLSLRRAREMDGADGLHAMRMLLLCGSFCFAEAMARMLVLRLGWLRLPAVPRSVVCITLFRVALEIGGYAPAAAVAIAAVFELTFFVRACRAIAAALEIHPFKVRGAKHWNKLA